MQRRLLVSLLTSFIATHAFAGVGKVDAPQVNKGIAEIDYSAVRYGDSDGSRTNEQKHEVELEYGLTDRFSFGIQTELEREPGEGSKFEAYGIEAQYEMTEQGEYWLGSAIKGEFAKAFHSGDADEIEAELIAARSWGPTKLTANLGLGREIGDNRDSGISVGTAVQATYKINKYFSPGVEWHADYGKLNSLGEDDSHYVGPVVTGKLLGLGNGVIEYAAGYYWGVSGDTTDNAARIQLEYEIAF